MMEKSINGIRIGVVIEREQDDLLEELIVREGRSKSWIVRQGVDLYFKKAGIKKAGK